MGDKFPMNHRRRVAAAVATSHLCLCPPGGRRRVCFTGSHTRYFGDISWMYAIKDRVLQSGH